MKITGLPAVFRDEHVGNGNLESEEKKGAGSGDDPEPQSEADLKRLMTG